MTKTTQHVVATTLYGKVRGKIKSGVEQYLGVPFAQPPVGVLRFRAPLPPKAWSGVLDALRPGPSAMQPKLLIELRELSEDCLNLNVWTPASDTAKRPVMVWIHGGGFMFGSGSQKEYIGSGLAQFGDVVVVTFNYRLGIFGNCNLKDHLGDSLPTDLNNGVRDQIAALEWVRDNIDKFGGDKNNVTIFGESAGGMSVGSLLGSPLAKGLFHKAIAQSGAGHTCVTRADSAVDSKKALIALNIDQSNAQQLLEVSAKDLLRASKKVKGPLAVTGPWKLPNDMMGFLPIIDGDVLDDHPISAVAQGRSSHVPLLIGSNRDEWQFFSTMAKMAPSSVTSGLHASWMDVSQDNLARVFASHIGDNSAQRAVQAYQQELGQDATPSQLVEALLSDAMFTIPGVRMAEAQAVHQPDNTFMYRFDFESTNMGACHSIDIPFVFGTKKSMLGQLFLEGKDCADELIASVMQAWVNFAKNGNPSNERLPDWPAYSCSNSKNKSNTQTMIFDTQCRIVKDLRADTVDLWKGLK